MNRTTHNLAQGTPDWHKHRASHLNASEASAMMGASKYRTRSDLLREKATGIPPEVSDAQQRLFDAGHAAEAAIRPVIELAIGEELYPVTMSVVINGLQLSASMDGLTLAGETAFEAKLWNEELVAQVQDGELEPHYYWQLEQILLCSGAERVIFATGDGGEKLATLEYRAVPGRADALLAGWKQFERDLAAYVPEQTEAKPIAAPVEGFGVLALRVEGRVLASNLDAFRAGADAFLARLPKPAELQTDQDFADADAAVKACAEAEDRIKAAKALALAQMADVDAVLRTADSIAETIRAARLALDRAVFTEKDRRKSALVSAGVDAVRAHYAEINATLGEHAIAPPATLASEIGGAIKGLKTLASMRDRIDAAVAAAKIDASQRARRVFECIGVLSAFDHHAHLFPDRVWLCANKAPDDLANLASMRVAEHQRREEQRIREAEERGRQQAVGAVVEAAKSEASRIAGRALDRILPRRIKLGDINAAIAPLSITADGLAQLGIQPAAKDGAAKLYDAADFEEIRLALTGVLNCASIARVA